MKSVVTVLGVAVLAGALPAYSHHSFAAYYFEQESVTVQGEMTEFVYKNPHAWVRVMVKDDTGQAQQYSAEWGNPGRLRRQQISEDTLKPGDVVIITGSPGRDAAERKIHLKRIERPSDGWSWRGARTPLTSRPGR
jgi:hypothetical protein